MTSDLVTASSCVRCFGVAGKKDGHRAATGQRFRCHGCRRTFTARTGMPFAGHRWPLEMITMAVRWYFRYRPSAADVRDLLAERQLDVSARTVLAWADMFGPLLATEGRRHARRVGTTWYADETYVRVAGRWAYLYRAVDEHGQVVDVLLRERRDLESARAFLAQAVAGAGQQPSRGPARVGARGRGHLLLVGEALGSGRLTTSAGTRPRGQAAPCSSAHRNVAASYEGLLEKNAQDTKGGAGQYFTPRPLIRAVVDVMRPAPGETVCDPACGTGGFLLAAHEYVAEHHPELDREQKRHLRLEALRGTEIVDGVTRLCAMNLLLHGVCPTAADEAAPPVATDDSLRGDPGARFDLVLTNPRSGASPASCW